MLIFFLCLEDLECRHIWYLENQTMQTINEQNENKISDFDKQEKCNTNSNVHNTTLLFYDMH